MLRALVLAVLAGGLIAVPVARADDPPRIKTGPGLTVERMLNTLHTEKVNYEKNLADTPLFELLGDLAKRYDLTFVIMEEKFKADGEANIKEKRPTLTATRIEGITVHRFLNLVLQDMGAAYLVRGDYLEIIPRSAVDKEIGLTEEAAEGRPDLPIVSLAVSNKPLADTINELARAYGLNVVMHAETRTAIKDVTVTERLLNVPADTALELLAGQANLSVVRKGNTFRITGGS